MRGAAQAEVRPLLLRLAVADDLFDLISNATKSGSGSSTNWISSIGSFLGFGRNALGTSSWRGGPTSVNEFGGELINLPRGAQVIPHDLSKRMIAGAPAVARSNPTFVLHSPVMTQDLLNQMNAIGAQAEGNAKTWATKNVPAVTQSKSAKQQQHQIGRRKR